MKKLVQAFVSLIIATSTFGGVTNVSAKENTPAYKVEYQDADSMKSVFKKELHKKTKPYFLQSNSPSQNTISKEGSFRTGT